MTEIDKALAEADANPDARPAFYELILKTTFFIPTHTQKEPEGTDSDGQDSVFPLIAESDGKDFLILFDTQERLVAWAKEEVPYIQLPGHMVVEMSTDDLFWALNAGTETQRVFVPDEISWLKKVVQQCKEIEETQRPADG